MSLSPMLDQVLRLVARPYALAPLPEPQLSHPYSTQAELAYCLEQIRLTLSKGQTPSSARRDDFLTALAQLIKTAVSSERPDYSYLSQVLKHHSKDVQRYLERLSTYKQDQRVVQRHINAIAHPEKLKAMDPNSPKRHWESWYFLANAEQWSGLQRALTNWLALHSCQRAGALLDIIQLPELQQLLDFEQLSSTPDVQRYLHYRQQNGPLTGSPEAIAQGKRAQARGAHVEEQTQATLTDLAQSLRLVEQHDYRVVSAVHFPAHLIAGSQYAKTEWDALLLRKATTVDKQTIWDVCLLVEAKANPEAASTDLRRLLRGLALLTDLPAHTSVYFSCEQGDIALNSNSLLALALEPSLKKRLLYCCPPSTTETLHRPSSALHAASRMQLLCAPASLNYAYRIQQGADVHPHDLTTVWEDLLHSPHWRAVLYQYAHQQQVGELLVTTTALAQAIQETMSLSALSFLPR